MNWKNLVNHHSKRIGAICLSASLMGSITALEAMSSKDSALASSGGFLEYQWDAKEGYKKLKYYQSSNGRNDRATYYLFLRPRDRTSGIVKITLNIPDYFETKITPGKLSLCKVRIGGSTSRTKCLETIPAAIEINEDRTTINFYPEKVIPDDRDSYAIKMKIFNPNKRGMFQLSAFSQSAGDLPISLYIGTWNLSIR